MRNSILQDWQGSDMPNVQPVQVESDNIHC